jgi:hypothetical protein
MKQFTAIVFTMALLAVPANSQTSAQQSVESRCTAKFAQAISIRGVHLGMSADELFALFPWLAESPNIKSRLENAKEQPHFGVAAFVLEPRDNAGKEKLAGISHLQVTLFDNRIVSYSVSYEDPPRGAQWDTTDEWIAKLSETLNLPDISEWNLNNGYKTLSCEGVRITASAGGTGGSVSVHTDDWRKQIKAREKAYQEQKRRDFKP